MKKKKQIKQKYKAKIGDKVVIIRDMSNHFIKLKSIRTIIDRDDSHYCIDGGDWILPAEFEIAPPITKSKKYWIAVDEKGNPETVNGNILAFDNKKSINKGIYTPVRATLTWNIEGAKK